MIEHNDLFLPSLEGETPEEDLPDGQALMELLANDDTFKLYLREVGRVPLLTAEQEISLAQRIERGKQHEERQSERLPFDEQCIAEGRQARNKLVAANLRLVISVAKKKMGKGVALLDLIQEGNLGLIRATEKFDWRKGFRFTTYATWWIRQAVSRAIAEQARTIRIPVHIYEDMGPLYRAREHFVQEEGREPTPEELAAMMDWTINKVKGLLEHSHKKTISLETPVGETEEQTLGDFLEDSTAGVSAEAERADLREQLDKALESLTVRERRVIRLRFGLEDGKEHTLEEVGKHFKVTRERIRQIEVKAIRKLRYPSRSRTLVDFLG